MSTLMTVCHGDIEQTALFLTHTRTPKAHKAINQTTASTS